MRLWVIGAGGLFGSALTRHAATQGASLHINDDIPWDNPDVTRERLSQSAQRFLFEVRKGDEPWGIAWAAGRITTSSTESEAGAELSLFTDFIHDLRRQATEISPHVKGSFFLSSSAGGVYGGSKSPPFDSLSEPAPVGAYGSMKRAQETLLETELTECFNVTIARLANLYGPGQNLTKLQGLVSRLALSAITREPTTMFVPLDTLRDYIYVDDAAAISYHWMTNRDSVSQVRVIASGNPTSLGQIIGLVQDVAHCRVPVAYGFHPSAAHQAHDLRLTPDTDDWTHTRAHMPLPTGIRLTFEDIFRRHQEPSVLALIR